MDLSLSTSEFKALSSESRVSILKLLEDRNHTLSELSTKTGMAAPTIKEHTRILQQAGLVQVLDEGRKWKYYTLTRKGKDILGARLKQTNFLILLSSTAIAGLVGLALLFSFSNMPPTLQSSNAYNSIQQTSGIQMPFAAEKTAQVATDNIISESQVAKICQPATEQNITQVPESSLEQLRQACQGTSLDECEQKDSYNIETNEFGKADGKPDCQLK